MKNAWEYTEIRLITICYVFFISFILSGCHEEVDSIEETDSSTNINDKIDGAVNKSQKEENELDPKLICEQSNEWARVKLNGEGCPAEWNDKLSTTIIGRIINASSRTLDIDTCGQCEDCEDSEMTLSVESESLPMLDSIFLPNMIVRIDVTMHSFHQCSVMLLIRNEPEWCGFSNPVATDKRLYLAISDGSIDTTHGLFSIIPQPLDCFPDAGPNCGGTIYNVDSYELEFVAHESNAEVRVPMGYTEELEAGNDTIWEVHNIRSFQTDICDDYWNWAYWVAAKK